MEKLIKCKCRQGVVMLHIITHRKMKWKASCVCLEVNNACM